MSSPGPTFLDAFTKTGLLLGVSSHASGTLKKLLVKALQAPQTRKMHRQKECTDSLALQDCKPLYIPNKPFMSHHI